MTAGMQFGIVLAATTAAFIAGIYIAKSIRMKDYGWKLGLMFGAIAMGTCVAAMLVPKLGIDLRGGVILIYEVDEKRTVDQALAQGVEVSEEDQAVDMDALIMALGRRVNPGGVREVVIRPYGQKQVEIIIPDVSQSEIDLIKQLIEKSGFLKFRIVAHPDRNRLEWELGQEAKNSEDELVRTDTFVYDDDRNRIAEWVPLGREETTSGEPGPYKISPEVRGEMLTRELVPDELEVLTVIDPKFQVEGKHIRSVASGYDDQGQPRVEFQMSSEGSRLFEYLTSSNLPDKQTGSYAKLGIVMDGELISAPRINSTISTNGVIEGRFSNEEVDYLVRALRAGRLPAVLQPEPISENNISPLLGEDTIRSGKSAIAASLVIVMIFMLVYYRFAGIVACLALSVNLLLIYGLMVLIKAAFTLPGLAGLVLTVGMSVDANVLIFERIREELRRGATLRMAIRNGFDRAITTIVDASLTTLITGIVLYAIGTDQIKGFAITLVLGILMSMFTAIFCSRAVFEIAERKRWLTRLNMMQILGETHLHFLDKRLIAGVCSVVLIALGVVAVTARGKNLLDIDFLAGTSVQFELKQPLPIQDVRSRTANIADDVWVTEINPENKEKNTVYKIDATEQDEKELQKRVRETLVDDAGNSLLVSHSLTYSAPQAVEIESGSAASPAETSSREHDQALIPVSISDTQIAASQGDATALRLLAQNSAAPPSTEMQGTGAAGEDRPAAAGNEQSPSTPAADDGETTVEGDASRMTYRTESQLTFDEKISARTLEEMLLSTAEKLGMSPPRIKLLNPEWNGRSERGYSEWTAQFTTGADQTTQILEQVEQTLGSTPVWLSSNKIGSKVAGDMTNKAILAILISLLGIVGYIWIRFQKVAYGLAAVLALVHDVLITLGAIAVSAWLANVAGFLLIDEFKISLPIVAAFMTIIGYSLNDTIVVFDRVREVKGKSPEVTSEIIDTSINQTLSRTVLTSLTTLLVVAILFVFGGQGIHGFAFALLVGVLVGTYSSIFVASPALLWMTHLSEPKTTKRPRPAQVPS